MSGQVYDSLDEALQAAQTSARFVHPGCASPCMPACRRLTQDPHGSDHYEPCEPALAADGLPDLFFCSPFHLTQEARASYEHLSARLWGGQPVLYDDEIQQEIKDIIKACIHEWDPYGLLGAGAPKDEFDKEIERIVDQLEHMTSTTATTHVISEVFNRAFCTEHFSPTKCSLVANKIYTGLNDLGYI